MASIVSMNDFCDVVLREIFKHLDGKSLKSASEVCVNWAFLIGSSRETMEKLCLTVVSKVCVPSFIPMDQKGADSTRLKRKHRHFSYENNNMYSTCMVNHNELKLFKAVRNLFDLSNLKSLSFKTDVEDDVIKVIRSMAEMPKLEKVNFVLIRDGFDGTGVEPLELPQLTTLRIRSPQANILKYFRVQNLSKLTVYHYMRGNQDQELAEFVNRCHKLKRLSLSIEALEEMIIARQEFNFRLEKFKVNKRAMMLPNHLQVKLHQFMFHQSPTLLETNMCRLENLSKPIVDTIFRMKHMTKLTIGNDMFEETDELYSGLEPVPTVTKLCVKIAFPTIESSNAFMRLFPNVKSLVLVHSFPGSLNFIADAYPGLTDLVIDSFKGSLDQGKKFGQLKTLKIGVLKDNDRFVSMIVNSPSLEKVSVLDLKRYQFTDDVIEVLLQQTKLHHLNLRVRKGIIIRPIFEKINEYPGSLRTLSLKFCSKKLTFDFKEENQISRERKFMNRYALYLTTSKMMADMGVQCEYINHLS